jgi:hypothetical protein
MLRLKVNDESVFRVTDLQGRVSEERLTAQVDFWGNMSITSDRGSHVEFSIYNGVFNVLSFRGKTNTALHALTLGLSRFPYTEEKRLTWSDRPPLDLALSRFAKSIADFCSFVARPVTVISNYHTHSDTNGSVGINGEVDLRVFGQKKTTWKTYCGFHPDNGITEIEVTNPRGFKLKARRDLS